MAVFPGCTANLGAQLCRRQVALVVDDQSAAIVVYALDRERQPGPILFLQLALHQLAKVKVAEQGSKPEQQLLCWHFHAVNLDRLLLVALQRGVDQVEGKRRFAHRGTGTDDDEIRLL